MKTAIISDVHGNYPALMNVIKDAISNNVNQFVFIGDYIFDLPFSNEVARLLMTLEKAYIIKGNKETYLYNLVNENQVEWVYDQMGGIYQTFRELAPDVLDFLVSLKEELYIPINPDITLYATHYFKDLKPTPKANCSSSNFHRKMLDNPFSHQDFLLEFNGLLKKDEYKECIAKINANVIVFGHNHLQCFGHCEGKLIINPGSCGQPLDFKNSAAYSILEDDSYGLNVIERRVTYDVDSVISDSKASKLYEKGRIWSELVFLALKTGRDYFSMFFDVAQQLALSKNEVGVYFSNETWKESYDIFSSRLQE